MIKENWQKVYLIARTSPKSENYGYVQDVQRHNRDRHTYLEGGSCTSIFEDIFDAVELAEFYLLEQFDKQDSILRHVLIVSRETQEIVGQVTREKQKRPFTYKFFGYGRSFQMPKPEFLQNFHDMKYPVSWTPFTESKAHWHETRLKRGFLKYGPLTPKFWTTEVPLCGHQTNESGYPLSWEHYRAEYDTQGVYLGKRCVYCTEIKESQNE